MTSPQRGKWNVSVGIENGIESNYSYTINLDPLEFTYPFTTFYKVRSTQSVGYSSWFYLQSRIAYSLGFSGLNSGLFPIKRHNFFDYDLSAVFPIPVSKKWPITLQPQIGVAHMHEVIVVRGVGESISESITYYTAPLIGLIVGFEPTQSLTLRSGLNFQFPKAKKQSDPMLFERGPKYSLSTARHAIDLFLDAALQLSEHFEVSMTAELCSFSVYGLLFCARFSYSSSKPQLTDRWWEMDFLKLRFSGVFAETLSLGEYFKIWGNKFHVEK